MAEPKMALVEYLRKLGVDADFLRQGVELLTRLVMELEVEEAVGAQRYERCASRSTQRNGYRPRSWETRVGEIPLRTGEVAAWELLSKLLGAQTPGRKGPLGRGPECVRERS